MRLKYFNYNTDESREICSSCDEAREIVKRYKTGKVKVMQYYCNNQKRMVKSTHCCSKHLYCLPF